MPAPSVIQFRDLSAEPALKLYAQQRARRGKDRADTLRKIMREWVFLAYDLVPPGDKVKIRNYLMSSTRAYAKQQSSRFNPRTAKVRNEMRGTMALAIVRKFDYKGAASLSGTALAKVAKAFVRARVFSSNLHRAGFFPAFDALHGRPAGTSGPRYKKHPPGGISEELADNVASILVENWASSKDGDGISGIAGSCFAATLPKVVEKFAAYALKDELADARKYGFTTRIA